jgi:uncharacterized Tic20 family protein
VVSGLSDNDRLAAVAVHACVFLGFAMWGPLVVYLLYKDADKSAYVRWRAVEALKFQVGTFVVVMVVAFLTCGLGTFLLFPWFALEAWMAWLAWQGKRDGYPLIGGSFSA